MMKYLCVTLEDVLYYNTESWLTNYMKEVCTCIKEFVVTCTLYSSSIYSTFFHCKMAGVLVHRNCDAAWNLKECDVETMSNEFVLNNTNNFC